MARQKIDYFFVDLFVSQEDYAKLYLYPYNPTTIDRSLRLICMAGKEDMGAIYLSIIKD